MTLFEQIYWTVFIINFILFFVGFGLHECSENYEILGFWLLILLPIQLFGTALIWILSGIWNWGLF